MSGYFERRPFTKKQRLEQIQRFGGRCGYCGIEHTRLQIDHITPVVMGGAHDPTNWMPSCPQCNNYKHFHGLETFRKMIADQCRLGRAHSVNYRFALKFGLIEEKPVEPVVFYFERVENSS